MTDATTDAYDVLMGFREDTLSELEEQNLWERLYPRCPCRTKDNKCTSHFYTNNAKYVCTQSECTPFYFLKEALNYNLLYLSQNYNGGSGSGSGSGNGHNN